MSTSGPPSMRSSVSGGVVLQLQMIRKQYFEHKDVLIEMALELSKAIENNFTFDEQRKPDSRVVFSSFNDVH